MMFPPRRFRPMESKNTCMPTTMPCVRLGCPLSTARMSWLLWAADFPHRLPGIPVRPPPSTPSGCRQLRADPQITPVFAPLRAASGAKIRPARTLHDASPTRRTTGAIGRVVGNAPPLRWSCARCALRALVTARSSSTNFQRRSIRTTYAKGTMARPPPCGPRGRGLRLRRRGGLRLQKPPLGHTPHLEERPRQGRATADPGASRRSALADSGLDSGPKRSVGGP